MKRIRQKIFYFILLFACSILGKELCKNNFPRIAYHFGEFQNCIHAAGPRTWRRRRRRRKNVVYTEQVADDNANDDCEDCERNGEEEEEEETRNTFLLLLFALN